MSVSVYSPFYILAVFLTAVPAGILLVMHSDFIYGNINAVSRIEFGIGNKLPVFDLVAVFFAFIVFTDDIGKCIVLVCSGYIRSGSRGFYAFRYSGSIFDHPGFGYTRDFPQYCLGFCMHDGIYLLAV